MEGLLFFLVLFVVLVGGGRLMGKGLGRWIFGKDEEDPFNKK